MSVDDSKMPLSKDAETPQVYKLEIKEPNYNGVQLSFLFKFVYF